MIEEMLLRRVIGVSAIVTFAVTSVLCGCRPSLAATLHGSSSATQGCHGGRSEPEKSGSPSHEHERNCQHCNHAQFLESKDAGKVLSAPALQPLLLTVLTSEALKPHARFASAQWVLGSRTSPPPLYLLNRVFLI